jgi:DNA primase
MGFVMDLESVSVGEAFRIIRRYVPVKTDRKLPSRDKPNITRLKTEIPGYVRLSDIQQPSQIEKIALNYLRKRGLKSGDIKFWSLGLSDTYSGYIVAPIIECGRTVYFVARRFLGGGPKYNNPPTSEWGVGKSELIYNYEPAAREASRGINVVEGIFDVFATGHRSIALLGKHPSEFQLSRIIMMNPGSINIMLDSDAQAEAYGIAGILGELFPTKVTLYKSGDPAERVATNDKEEVQYSFKELVRHKLSRK